MHVILDNFSAHKTSLVKQFLVEYGNVTLHFTPTYPSWLNQIKAGSADCSVMSLIGQLYTIRRPQTQNHAVHPPLREGCQTT